MPAAPTVGTPIPWRLSLAIEHLHRHVILGFLLEPSSLNGVTGEVTEGAVLVGGPELRRGITVNSDQRCLVIDRRRAPLHPSQELVSALRRLARNCAGVGVLTPRVGVLLRTADRVVVSGPAGCLAFLNPDAIRRSAVLEVVVDPLKVGSVPALVNQWPDLVVEHGTLHVPLLDRTSEDVLAECRSLGLVVGGTRVHYPLLEPLAGPAPATPSRSGELY